MENVAKAEQNRTVSFIAKIDLVENHGALLQDGFVNLQKVTEKECQILIRPKS